MIRPSIYPPTQIGGVTFEWGSRTFVMGIVNVTPDSFSGDGVLAGGAPSPEGDSAAGDSAAGGPSSADAATDRAVAQARRMVAEGADILDVGGESTRPGHLAVDAREETARVVPVIAAIRAALPGVPISIDTTKPAVAEEALDAGASLLNDVWGTGPTDQMAKLAARRNVPLVLMHNRAEPQYADLMAEVIADLRAALDRAMAAGVPRHHLIVDPGFGFGKRPEHNLEVLDRLSMLAELGQPVLLGTSRKSTIGIVLGGVPPDQRLEGTLATTALGIAAGADIVRVHDVRANVMVCRMCDAVVRRNRK